MKLIEDTTDIYRHLQDDRSRFLFEKRACFSLTGDERYIDDIIDDFLLNDAMSRMMERMIALADKLIIWGAGNDYYTLKRRYPSLDCAYFCDKDPVKRQTGELFGRPVISPEELFSDYRDYYVAVNSAAYNQEMLDLLKSHDFPENHILNPGECYQSICNLQYFEPEIIQPVSDEVFVDGGTYDGSTFRRFAEWCKGDYKRIYAFEPDGENFERCKQALVSDPVRNVDLMNRGLWSGETELNFDSSGTQGSQISETKGSITIRTVSVDSVVRQEDRVTFLKLDVEGAELEALKGARDTILRCHPRMTISLYHKPEDIFELPGYVLSLCPDYRFYIRHYQLSRFETILYAL